MSLPEIFSFHNVSNNINLGLNNISTTKFEKIYNSLLRLSESKKIEICFDDGYEDVLLNAAPLIQNNTIPVTIFPITKYIGQYNKWDVNFIINRKKHLDYNQLKFLNTNSWKIGSHGHNHISYKVLTKDRIYKDLKMSKDLLEDNLNIEIKTFTPPFGHINDDIIPLIIKAGYTKLFVNSHYISFDVLNDSKLKIFNRLPVYSHDSDNSINRKINKNKFQTKFDKFIHFWANATVLVKKIS